MLNRNKFLALSLLMSAAPLLSSVFGSDDKITGSQLAIDGSSPALPKEGSSSSTLPKEIKSGYFGKAISSIKGGFSTAYDKTTNAVTSTYSYAKTHYYRTAAAVAVVASVATALYSDHAYAKSIREYLGLQDANKVKKATRAKTRKSSEPTTQATA